MPVSKRLAQYVETALWSTNIYLLEGERIDSCSDIHDGDPFDKHFDINNLSLESHYRMNKDINDWFDHLEERGLYDLASQYADDEQIAHDFWLTRNGHGAGYWDGDYGKELGETLSKACKSWGECDLWLDVETMEVCIV